MSAVSERYVRCPNCRYPNLAGSGICTQCGAELEEALNDDLSRAASETWYEVRKLMICAGAGLLAGGLVAVTAAAITHGIWLEMIQDWVTPGRRGGRYRGGSWILLAAMPISWAMLAPKAMKSTLGGSVEVFGEEEIHAGAWASGVLTAILLAAAFAVPHTGSRLGMSGESLNQLGRMAPQVFWVLLPWICQIVAIVVAVGVHRWQEAHEV
jgi:cytochrome bd-type quinol oxidase subunit 2